MLNLHALVIPFAAFLGLIGATTEYPDGDALKNYTYATPSAYGFATNIAIPERIDLHGDTFATARVEQTSGSPILVAQTSAGPFAFVFFDAAGKRHTCDDPNFRNSGTEPVLLSRPGRHFNVKTNLSRCGLPIGAYRAALEGATAGRAFLSEFYSVTVF